MDAHYDLKGAGKSLNMRLNSRMVNRVMAQTAAALNSLANDRSKQDGSCMATSDDVRKIDDLFRLETDLRAPRSMLSSRCSIPAHQAGF
jgi:hypothetical protein